MLVIGCVDWVARAHCVCYYLFPWVSDTGAFDPFCVYPYAHYEEVIVSDASGFRAVRAEKVFCLVILASTVVGAGLRLNYQSAMYIVLLYSLKTFGLHSFTHAFMR